ncbi:hypothetical protein BJY52DRAFT_1224096 [Lactarius psammicola]|nr:hypothetical protein BJY52DRAFT_1224096 [Lactarius psammicola]
MVLFLKLLSPATVLLTLLSIPTTTAASWPTTFKHTTNRGHYLGADRSLKLEGFGVGGANPLPTYQQYPRSTLDTSDTAVSFLASRSSVFDESSHLHTSAQGQAAHHVFLVQKVAINKSPWQNGVSVANTVANIAFNKHGKNVRAAVSNTVMLIWSTFCFQAGAADMGPSISLRDPNATAEKTFRGTYNGQPATLEFVVKPNGFAVLPHYHVIPIPAKDPDIDIDGFVDITDPENPSTAGTRSLTRLPI